ncbi:hypothetical protein COX93_02700 [Candidatus Nomurabacteria bacterium CG_4_10_14_0_2_um_filter_30_12]|uniref:Uncharacterized protein n=3 Tax=Candidatus Nomuraibacteriota TaxID=1752729 RepID=A0A1J4V289_9BACT|nr:MAG: hypothetical protein AUJ22_00190 [Candidatus Nomurabacteria bacterium CG1_02_31_12]PIR68728.1 MAG: hypothetical protein COU48_02590 [Candidatus Nomurabacteria bacterium CG10_big_fil_rev_8_21_14_0_10_03_31_7]PIZ86942.1 MAG: hypothetical protein COX93_02700 [Candidatus Nomurabacteria bacterium CG_4_10_14_0_2_um_filter_30_12]
MNENLNKIKNDSSIENKNRKLSDEEIFKLIAARLGRNEYGTIPKVVGRKRDSLHWGEYVDRIEYGQPTVGDFENAIDDVLELIKIVEETPDSKKILSRLEGIGKKSVHILRMVLAGLGDLASFNTTGGSLVSESREYERTKEDKKSPVEKLDDLSKKAKKY